MTDRTRINPFMARATTGRGKQSVGYNRASKQESSLARKIGGYKVPASGSGRIKGDVRKKGALRIECKCTQNKSFSVTRDMMDKIEAAALANDEIPAIHIEVLDETGKVVREAVVMDAGDFTALVGGMK